MTPAINEKKLRARMFFSNFFEMLLGCCLNNHKVLSDVNFLRPVSGILLLFSLLCTVINVRTLFRTLLTGPVASKF